MINYEKDRDNIEYVIGKYASKDIESDQFIQMEDLN